MRRKNPMTLRAGLGRADLHMHTTVSDGTMTVRALLDDVARRGDLDVIAITDHDRLDASLWAYARRERYPFDIVPGVEVSSAEGHILALWVMTPIAAGMSMAETVAAVHEAGGLAILAHPFFGQMGDIRRAARRYRRDPHYLKRAGLDGLEVFNASVVLPGSNRLAARVAAQIGLAATGGSDAHALRAVGTGLTHFPGGRTAQDLRLAITQRQTVVTGRPWPAAAYGAFVADFIARRGHCLSGEVDLPDDDRDWPLAGAV
jgi:hypothetical protein